MKFDTKSLMFEENFLSLFPFSPKKFDDQGFALAIPGGG